MLCSVKGLTKPKTNGDGKWGNDSLDKTLTLKPVSTLKSSPTYLAGWVRGGGDKRRIEMLLLSAPKSKYRDNCTTCLNQTV